MEPLRRLQDLLANVSYDQQDHREIYQFIEREVLSPKSPIIKYLPPLDVVVYSIKNMIYPNLALRRIPLLLDLLATVEFYRKRTLDRAMDAIVWNDHYKMKSTPLKLPSKDEALLKDLRSNEHSMREVYIKLLTTCCHLDMYLLWTASPPSMTNVMIRFNEYFPFINEYCNKKSPRLFQSDLSDTEISQLRHVGLICCNFAQESVDWALEYVEEGQPINIAFRSEEFRATFPRPCEDGELSHLISFFVGYVASAASRVKSIFQEGDA